MVERLAHRLKLEPHELRHGLTLASALFGITSSYTLVKTARDSFYLSQLPAQTLPYVYLGVGIVTLIASQIFARLTRRLPAWISLASVAIVTMLSLVLFAPLFQRPGSWVPVAFYLWVNVYGLILVSQFWAFANSIADPRLAKRIFGVVGTGGILGGLIGGLVASAFARAHDVDVLVLLGALLVAAIVPVIIVSVRRGVTPSGDPGPLAERVQKPWRSAYVRWFGLAALCSVMVTGVLDYQFKVQIQSHYPTRHALAHFFGLFYIAMNLGALLVQVLLTRRAMQSLGAPWSAFVLPAGLGLGAAATVAAPGIATVMGVRLWDQIIRFSLNKTAVELFYFPLEPALRRHAKAIIEAGLERVGDGLAAILILAVGVVFGADIRALGALVAALVVVWLIAWLELRPRYSRELGRGLRRLQTHPEHAAETLRERALLREMIELLDSPDENVVLYGMELLEQNARRLIENRALRLLEHRSPRVRFRALSLIAAQRSKEARVRVRALLADRVPQVRLEALRALCALGEGGATAALDPYLESEDLVLRATALHCLIQYAPKQEEARVLDVLGRRLRDGAQPERVEIAVALGDREAPSPAHDLILSLALDPDLEVRRAALRSAGRVGWSEHVDLLLEALEDPKVERAAREGLIAIGEPVIPRLADALADPDRSIEFRRRIPLVLGAHPCAAAVDALFRCRDRSDLPLRYAILRACNVIRRTDPTIAFPEELVREDLEYEFRGHLFLTVHYRECPVQGGPRAERFLCQVLDERFALSLDRVFRRLALLYPPRTFHAAYRSLRSPRDEVRGSALEYVETTLSLEDRAVVLPLLEDTADDERVRLAEERYGLRYAGYVSSLDALLGSDDPWLQACVLYVVGRRGERSLARRVESLLDAADPRVRETAAWTREALATAAA